MALFGKKTDPLEKTIQRILTDISGRVANGYYSFDIDVLAHDVGEWRLDDAAVEIANRIQTVGHNVDEISFQSSVKVNLHIEANPDVS